MIALQKSYSNYQPENSMTGRAYMGELLDKNLAEK